MRVRWASAPTFVLAAVAVFLAGVLQNTGVFSVAGVRPNFILAAVIASAFFVREWVPYLVLLLMAGVLLRFAPGFDAGAIAVVGFGAAAFFAQPWLPGRPVVASTMVIAVATAAVYAIVDPAFAAANAGVLAIEAACNVLIGAVLLLGMHGTLGNDKKIRTTI